MSGKHQSLKVLKRLHSLFTKTSLQVLRMAYNLKRFVGNRKIIQRIFRQEKIKGLAVQLPGYLVKPFLLSKNQICFAS
jgi:hypothetical protein